MSSAKENLPRGGERVLGLVHVKVASHRLKPRPPLLLPFLISLSFERGPDGLNHEPVGVICR